MSFNDTYRKFAVKTFGKTVDKYIDKFKILKIHLRSANMEIFLRAWISIVFLTTLVVFLASLGAVLATGLILNLSLLILLPMIFLVPILAAAFTFITFYFYPIQKSKKIKASIDRNLPFALAHMNAIASSGIPPEFLFELITKFEEYGEISKQAALIVRNIKTFGMSSIHAIRNVAQRTPSASFRQILNGIDSTIEKGGNLADYFSRMSEKTLFDYRLKREKYVKTLSTYADIYTALLIAAPLIMLTILGVLSVIGGDIAGLSVREVMLVIILLVIPVMNIGFLSFVHFTYPGT